MSERAQPQRLPVLIRPQLLGLAGLAVAGGALVTISNSVPLQLAAIAGLADLLIAFALVRAGVAMSPAWPIVAWIYLLGPISSGADTVGTGFSAGLIVLMAIAPFPIFAIAARPHLLSGLVRLAPIALLAVLALLSLAWSSSPAYGSSKLLLWVTTVIIPAAFIVILARAAPVSWRLIALVGAAYVAVLIVFGADTPSYPGRTTIFGANPIWIGRAAIILAVVGVFGPFRLPLRLLLLAIGTVGAVLTGSAGPMVGFVAGVVAGAAVVLRARGWSDWRTLLALLGLAAVIAALLVAIMLGLLDPALDEAIRDPNNTSRPLFLFGAAKLFLASPLIGAGFGAFASTGLDVYPHNMVAEIAAELGVLGLLALGAWLVMVIRASIGSALMTALVATTFVFSLFSGNIAGEAEFWFFSALAVGLVPVIAGRGEGAQLVPVQETAASTAQPR